MNFLIIIYLHLSKSFEIFLIAFDFNFQVVFSSEWWYIVFMALFSISNGYIGNIGFMFAPKVVASEYQDVAAAFTVAMLVGGCGVGSVISNSIVKML